MASQTQNHSIESSYLTTSHKANPGARISKRRAPRACQLCRLRKVRCNMVAFGPPCSNCKCDKVSCVETPRKRRGGQQNIGYLNSGLASPAISSSEQFEFETFDTDALTSEYSRLSGVVDFLLEGIDLETFEVTDYGTGYEDSQELTLNMELPIQSLECVEAIKVPSNDDLYDPNSQAQPILNIEEFLPDLAMSTETSGVALDLDPKPKKQNFLPCYIQAIPENLDRCDIEYLFKNGAFTIPGVKVRDRLLSAYVEHVHPDLPLISLREFLEDLRVTKSQGKTSLLLMQTILLAASACVDMSVLDDMGFESRQEAVETFYQRTTLLYKMGYESDRPTLIQSLVLLAYATASRESDKGRYWINIAIGCTYQIGLNKQVASSKPVKEQRLLRRIWWCSFVQDRLLALQSRTRTYICDGDFNIPLIALTDFDILDNQQLPNSDVGVKSWGVEEQTHIALLFIQKAKLCFCIGHVVNAQYSLLSRNSLEERVQGDHPRAETMQKIPNGMGHGTSIEKFESELSVWLKSLPSQYSWKSQPEQNSGKSWMKLHQCLLRIIYLVTVSVLHQPYDSFSALGIRDEENSCSGLRAREASSAIQYILLELYTSDLIRHIPVNAVPLFIPTVINNLMAVGTSGMSGNHRSAKHPSDLLRVLEQLSESSSEARNAIPVLHALFVRLPSCKDARLNESGGALLAI